MFSVAQMKLFVDFTVTYKNWPKVSIVPSIFMEEKQINGNKTTLFANFAAV